MPSWQKRARRAGGRDQVDATLAHAGKGGQEGIGEVRNWDESGRWPSNDRARLYCTHRSTSPSSRSARRLMARAAPHPVKSRRCAVTQPALGERRDATGVTVLIDVDLCCVAGVEGSPSTPPSASMYTLAGRPALFAYGDELRSCSVLGLTLGPSCGRARSRTPSPVPTSRDAGSCTRAASSGR